MQQVQYHSQPQQQQQNSYHRQQQTQPQQQPIQQRVDQMQHRQHVAPGLNGGWQNDNYVADT